MHERGRAIRAEAEQHIPKALIVRTNQPLVSVSLVTFNHERFIASAIRSVLDQSLPDLELVIVDDGSTDATPSVIASFDDPRIVSIRQENRGPGAAGERT